MKRREAFKIEGNNFVFHVEGKPLNYGTILTNYRRAQRISGVNFTCTHVLRYGMAKVARKVSDGLGAVMSMTGHQDMKLADHYSKLTEDDQKETSLKIMDYVRSQRPQPSKVHHATQNLQDILPKNVLELSKFRKDITQPKIIKILH